TPASWRTSWPTWGPTEANVARLRRRSEDALEGDHRTNALAAAHRVEGGFDVVEADPGGDQALDREAATEAGLGQAGKVDRRIGESVVRAEDPEAAVDDRVAVERRARALGGHPDQY